MNLAQWVEFPPLGDERGSLVALEGGKSVPFEIKRAYYIFGTKEGVARGFHAHRNLQQLAVCVTGKCRMVLDNGKIREEVWLNSPTRGLLIGNMLWREMHDFSPDCVLLVLASEHYDETDYIRNYDLFCGNSAPSIQLVPYDEMFLNLSWDWLNDPEIKQLTMSPSFTKEQQLDFFKSLKDRQDYLIYGIALGSARIGACGLKSFRDGMAELWLYIGDKSLWGRGLGTQILFCLEKQAKSLGLGGLYLKVSKENISAQKLYEKNSYYFADNDDHDKDYRIMEKQF